MFAALYAVRLSTEFHFADFAKLQGEIYSSLSGSPSHALEAEMESVSQNDQIPFIFLLLL